MATEQFSLCWNNFHSNLSSGFHSLYQSEDFVDVTLAADGRYLKAHKMVLSVCSQYFKELFHANPCKHPIVILKDVSYTALRDLLQFMYLGEVSVSQEELSNLMKVAELLQIKGLTEENVDTSHMNQNGLKNVHVTDVKSLSDPRSYLKRAKSLKKSRSEVPAKISKSNSLSECRDSQSPCTLEIDSNPSLLVESELIEPVKPVKEEPADYSTESGNQSEHSIPDMDVSSMLDTNLGETSSSSCWKSDSKIYGPSGSNTAEEISNILLENFILEENIEQVTICTVLEVMTESLKNIQRNRVFKFTRSRKGMPHLIYDSNLFRPSGKVGNSLGTHKYWECVQNRKTGCKARCMTVNGAIEMKCREHNHNPPVEYIWQRESMGAVYYMPL